MAFEGIWIEGTDLHVIDSTDGSEWKYTGTYVSKPVNAIPGSIWIESGDLHYIDAYGDKRKIPSVVMGKASGIVGSAWKSGRFLSFIDEMNQIRRTHTDIAYGNMSEEYTPHTDYYVSPSHTDYDTHSNHSDVEHGDIPGSHTDDFTFHSNNYMPHSDGLEYFYHADYSDHYDAFGNNSPHINRIDHLDQKSGIRYNNEPEQHYNTEAHYSNSDTHSNYSKTNHSDSGDYYNSYSPGYHGDISHVDSPHYDSPYRDSPVKVS